MVPVCLVFPILPGKTEAARAMHVDLETTRKPDYARSEKRLGIDKEYWYIASLPSGDQLVGYFEVEDLDPVLNAFIASTDPFDLWFKKSLADVTGVDLNNPPADMKLPELVSRHEA
jgi:hypothetical protein